MSIHRFAKPVTAFSSRHRQTGLTLLRLMLLLGTIGIVLTVIASLLLKR